MIPAIIGIPIGLLAIVWGAIVAARPVWASERLGRRMRRAWGALAEPFVTPSFLRVTGIGMVALGVLIVVSVFVPVLSVLFQTL